MDSPRDTDGTTVLETDEAGRDGRDLRDVLRHLVVADGADLSLEAVASAAAGADRLVPELLGALADDETAVRIGAAWALCALADDQPAAVGYLASRLAERVGDDAPFEVEQVLAYLRGTYPGRVADAVDAAVETDPKRRVRADEPCVTDPNSRPSERPDAPAERPDGPAGTESNPDRGKRIETDGGVPAGTVADLGDGRQVVRSTERADRPRSPAGPTPVRESGDAPTGPPGRSPSSDPPADHPTHPDFGSSDADPARSRDASARTPRTDRPTGGTSRDPAGQTPTESETPETPETFAAIGSLSALDRLSAVDTGVEDRYATGYRCRAVRDEREFGTAVRLFDRPEEGNRLAFRADLEDCLARWQALADGETAVEVAEWGVRPRPWVRTEAVDDSLAGRERPPVDRAVDQAVALARAVGDLHARGTVHGGIDPKNVVYPCEVDALDRPMLDNVGLMGVFRQYFEPANYLDPRFAAPEYFDDDFGSVDAATDVYGVGATVYYLVTGRPPFDGSYGEVRRGVLNERPPAPSAVRDAVPEALDPVLAKALAKSKIRRYDAVEALVSDLQRVCDGR